MVTVNFVTHTIYFVPAAPINTLCISTLLSANTDARYFIRTNPLAK